MPSRPSRRALDPTDPTLDDAVAVLWGAGDGQRARILRLLAHDSFAVGELSDLLGQPQPAISHHLKLLASAGWVVTRKEGASTYYRRALHRPDDPLAALRAPIAAALDACPLDQALQSALDELHERRRGNSEAFFLRHAAAFREHQDQIVELGAYLDALQQLVAATTSKDRRLAVELGPGPGELLTALAGRYRRVVGIDTSAAMLAQARARVRSLALANVRLVLGDVESLAEQHAVDAVFACMVLHHLPSPAGFFPAVRAALAPGGRVYVAELCSHQQDWAREYCGDLWLGFDTEELVGWAAHAGLAQVQAQYLGQRNGFRIQLHAFRRTDP